MDVGVWMRPEVLAHKLEARDEDNHEQVWNLSRWPTRLSGEGKHRLFVASEGAWRGYFTLSLEALYSPNDASAAYALLFEHPNLDPHPAGARQTLPRLVPRAPSDGAADTSGV